MRQVMSAALAVMGAVLAAGCGVLEPATDKLKDRDVNHDGLVTMCEGLGLETCAATPGCRPIRSTGGEGTARACEHDGDGGCKQAVDYFSCVPVTPPPCSYLGRQECAADPRCELVEAMCTMECRPDGNGGCLPCNAPFYCAPKPPPPPSPCEGLTLDRCELDARCDIASVYQCSGGGVSGAAGATTSSRTVQPEYCVEEKVCVPHEPNVCENLPIGICMTTPGCAIEIPAACKMACFLPEGCPDCVNPQPRCVPMDRPVPPAERCEELPVELCEANPACEVQEGPVCMIACFLPEGCPPCATPRKFCAPKPPMPPPARCEQLPVELCASNPACEVVEAQCPLLCEPDGRGGCAPCNLPKYCAPKAPRPEYCSTLSRSQCAVDPSCELVEAMCTMECRPDGAGGCLPCNAPFMCVPRQPMPPPDCVTLTPASCARVPGCEVRTETVCTMECTDNSTRPASCHPGTCFPLEGCFPIDEGCFPIDPNKPVPVHDGGSAPPSVGSGGSDGSTR